MALQVQRTGAQQLSAALQAQQLVDPARLSHGAARGMHRQQVFMPHEGRRCGLRREQRIPRRGIDLRRVVVNADQRVRVGRGKAHACGIGSATDLRRKPQCTPPLADAPEKRIGHAFGAAHCSCVRRVDP